MRISAGGLLVGHRVLKGGVFAATGTAAGLVPGDERVDVAVISVETASIRVRVDGTAPTASVGHLVDPGQWLVLETHDEIMAFSAIRTGSTSAGGHYTLYRPIE